MFAGNEGKMLTAVQLEEKRKERKRRERGRKEGKEQTRLFFFKVREETLTQRNTLTKSRWRKASEK